MKQTFSALYALSIFLLSAISADAQTIQPVEPPIMGWSSWNTYRININESLIKRQAEAMVSLGLKDAGYRYINIDDGFFGYRDEKGVLQTHPERFPNGVKGVADHIHRLGLKAGIYSDAGANTCGSLWDADPNGIGVGLYGHEKQDADLYFNQWGFDFIKIDYCGAGQQLDLDERERYTAISKAIREVCPRDISVNICRWAFPGTWARDLARSWRISGDISPRWSSVKSIIRKNLYLSAYAGGGHYNDMDMLEIGRGLTQTEEEVHFGMWCLMSSPLLIGCDLTAIPDASLKLLKNEELIALNQDPLGLQAYVVQHEGEGYVLVKDIEQLRGNVRAAALYNPSDSTCAFHVPLDLLELNGKVKVRDLVKQKDEKAIREYLSYTLPPHSVKILRLKAEQRLEPTRYEAEWAYLPLYNDLGKQKRIISPQSFEGASGRMIVTHIGGSKDNYMEWSNVHSDKGGSYTLTIAYLPPEAGKREVNDRLIEVEVNGHVYAPIKKLAKNRSEGICTVSLPVRLEPGRNTIRLGSAYTWTPDIDCITLEPQS
ncbi:alpha-galactosidase [Bacteroides sp. CAG:598]|nr:alpha-galactosidase [Bacteroides sp. CAG:598]